MGIADVVKVIGQVAALGASPAVQSLLSEWFSRKLGIPQKDLDAAILAEKDAPAPKV